jgi:hypothetical protein
MYASGVDAPCNCGESIGGWLERGIREERKEERSEERG